MQARVVESLSGKTWDLPSATKVPRKSARRKSEAHRARERERERKREERQTERQTDRGFRENRGQMGGVLR